MFAEVSEKEHVLGRDRAIGFKLITPVAIRSLCRKQRLPGPFNGLGQTGSDVFMSLYVDGDGHLPDTSSTVSFAGRILRNPTPSCRAGV